MDKGDVVLSGQVTRTCTVPESERDLRLAARDADGFLIPDGLDEFGSWLRYLLRFEDEPLNYWMLEEFDPRDGLTATVAVLETVTDPGAVEQAQQWAAGLLAQGVETPAWVEMDQCANPPTRPKVTQWLGLRYAGWTAYAPLFDSTPPCVLPVAGLDPATGADCDCRGTPRRCGSCRGCELRSKRLLAGVDKEHSLRGGEQDPTAGVEPLPWSRKVVPVQAAPAVSAAGRGKGWACMQDGGAGHVRERYAHAERPAGYAAQVIGPVDGRALLALADEWSMYLLAYDQRLKCWALHEVSTAHGFLRCVKVNVALPDRDDVPGAQRWAAQYIEAEQAANGEDADDWTVVPDPPDLVTEWRVLLFDGRVFYIALMNTTPPCQLPVADLLAGTGIDCYCRSHDDG
ncbi:hypothetical protein [Actinoplanes philippinensis]|uniref:hypothetical protein n=1 Tax=Actinoplanes philippinensis TaxID=35752 RepID=UPI00340C80DE